MIPKREILMCICAAQMHISMRGFLRWSLGFNSLRCGFIPTPQGTCIRTVFKLFTAAALTVGLSAQALAQETLELTDIRYQGSAGQVVWIELAESLGYLAPLKAKWVGNTISGPQDVQAVVTGDIDIGDAFNGALVKLLAKKAPVKAVLGYYGVDDNT